MSTPSTRPIDGVFFDRGGEGRNVCHSDYGADPTGVASSSDAVDEAVASAWPGPTGKEGGKIIIPPGTYRMTRNLVLGADRAVLLQGALGSGWYGGSQLVFEDGFGIVVTGVGTTAAVLRDLVIVSGGPANVVPGVHGVQLLKRAVLEHCRIAGFTGMGANVDASAVAGNNANLFRIYCCMIDGNGLGGVYTGNGDSNAGFIIGNDLSGNGGWGGDDNSFLGNTWIGNHADGNAVGAYRSRGATNQSVWVGNYAEGGTAGLVQIAAPGLWLGGPAGSHGVVTGTGLRIVGDTNDNRIDNARLTPLVGWTALTLGGGFVNVGGSWETAQFQVDGTGTCRLKGEIIGGTTFIAGLPQRPLKDQRFVVATANGSATVQVEAATGQLSIISGNVGSSHWVSLDIAYKTI